MKPEFVERSTGKGFTAHKPASEVEIPYVSALNRHLPDGIRIHAWSPVESDFSSRHSCLWRHYKYFFSLDPKSSFLRPKISFGSAYPPSSSSSKQNGPTENFAAMPFGSLNLDLPLMREGLGKILGDHDFRNLCKVDPGKQLTSHVRRVISASIDKVEGEEDVWVLNLRGGAFVRTVPFKRSLEKEVSNSVLNFNFPALQSSAPHCRSPFPNRRPTRVPQHHRQTPLHLRSNSSHRLYHFSHRYR